MNDEMVSQKTAEVTVTPESDLVLAKLPALRSKLRELVGSGVSQLTLDLSGVHMMDSAGIGLVVSTHNSLKKAGGELTLVHATQDILDLLKTMRIHQHLKVSGS
jgi:anti-sigma B factor antagonist